MNAECFTFLTKFILFCLLLGHMNIFCYGQQIDNGPSVYEKAFKAALPNVPGYMFRNKDGSPGGFPCEILEEMANDEGIKLEWVDGTWAESFEKIKKGELDILPGTQVSEERKEIFDFMDGALCSMWSELYVRAEVDFLLGDLNGKRIALTKDDNNSIQFTKYIKNYQVEYDPIEYGSHSEAVDALARGEAFAAVGPRLFDRNYLRNKGLKSAGFYFNPVKLTCAFSKGKNPDLIAAFDRRLNLYKADPQSVYYELIDKYGLGSSSASEEVVPKSLEYLLGTLAGIVIIATVFVIVLKQQVNFKTATIKAKEQELLEAHKELKDYSQTLEKKVAERTEELDKKNRELHQALSDVKTSQGRLVMSEKMAVLGHLSAGIAHEINSPLGAIGSASGVISDNAVSIIKDVEKLSDWFKGPNGSDIKHILLHVLDSQDYSKTLSTREDRVIRNTLSKILEENGIEYPDEFSRLLLELKLHTEWQNHIGFLKSSNSLEVLREFAKLAEILRGCSMIDVAVGKASRIVKALKSYMYSSSKHGEEYEFVAVDLRSSLENVLLLFHNQIKRGIRLDTSYENVSGILGDTEQLNQVWTNLVQNALHAVGESGDLSVSLSQEGGYAIVEVADNGYGIPEDIKEKVFEPLFTTKKAGEGTGLGLDIVKRIVEAHDGHIKLESKEGEGTKVRVYLPLSNSNELADVHMRG